MRKPYFTSAARVAALFALFLALAQAAPASADDWGAYKWTGGSGGYDCLYAGASIITGSNPDKHNVSASDACPTTYQVALTLIHYDAGGRVIDYCQRGYVDNHTQCQITESTGTGDYWYWYVVIQVGSNSYDFACSNQGSSYSACFSSSD